METNERAGMGIMKWGCNKPVNCEFYMKHICMHPAWKEGMTLVRTREFQAGKTGRLENHSIAKTARARYQWYYSAGEL